MMIQYPYRHRRIQHQRPLLLVQLLLATLLLLSLPLHTVSQEILGFRLIQAGTNRTVAQLWDGAVIAIPPNRTGLAIEALTTGRPIASILFGYDPSRPQYSVEKMPPYAMCGNVGRNFAPCAFLTVGTHRIHASISNLPDGSRRSIAFTLVHAAAVPVRAPVAVPRAVPVARPRKVPVSRPVAAPVGMPAPLAPLQPTPPQPPRVVPVVAPVPTPLRLPVATTLAPRASPSSAPPLLTFTLVYTVNNTDVMPLLPGSIVALDAFEAAQFNVRADATYPTQIQSLRFLTNNQSETVQPWAYCGNSGAIYNACADLGTAGTVTLTARPYTGPYLTGTVLPDVTVTFQFVGRPGPPVEQQFPLYISCGGGSAITDGAGRTWRPDQYFVGGSTYANAAVAIVNRAGDDDQQIYQSERYGNFVYEIPVPLGSYSVVLHFAEI